MSTGQFLGGGLGAVIGGILAAPTGGLSIAGGALLGGQIGLAVGGYLDPPKGPTVHGPRLGDKSVQTSTYGTMLPRFYGTIGVSGNITWLEHNQLKETVRKKKSGGKGGGSVSTVKTYTYSATFFLSLGEGPIAGVRRIWCQDKLIYNAGSDDLETIIASNQNAEAFHFYLGTDDQLPDPRYEAAVGVGNAPAYRGEAYIAFYDFQLADYGNSLQGAQFKVEVVTASTTGVSLLQQYTAPFTQPHNNISFNPKAYFVSQEKVVFYVPQWQNDYPATSSWLVYEFYTSGLKRTYSIPQTGIVSGDVPPTGDSDVEGDFWKSARAFFPASASFSDGSGYMQRRGSLYAGISMTPTKALHLSKGSVAGALSISTTANCFAISGGEVYSIAADGVRVYNDLLELQAFHALALPSLLFPEARAELVDGELLLFSGGLSPKVYRIAADFSEYSLLATLPSNSGAAYYSINVNLSQGMVVRANPGDSTKTLYLQWYNLSTFSQGPVPLAEVVEAEIALSSLLTAADVDTSQLTAQVRGYRVSGGSIRSALEPLQGAFPFDVIQSGYQLKCVPRGQASSVTIPWEDLGAADGDTPGDLLQESREMDSQLPALVALKYLDAAREYAVGEQSKGRINTQAINRVDREVSLVMTADEAAQMADILVNLPWLERTPAKFTLPPPYLALEPADVVTVVTPSATHEFRLTDINYTPDGRLECEAKPNRAALYTSNAKGGEGVPPSGNIPLTGQTILIPLDIPVVDETIQNTPGFGCLAASYAPGWPGAVAFRSIDGGQTWIELQGFSGFPSAGYARDVLPISTCTLIDQRSLIVDLISGELESVTRDQMLSGINYAAYGVNGRWEIVRFQDAALQGDGSYLVSGFVRGERGTEWATGLHAAGDYFVLLDDPDNAFIGMAVSSLGVAATYRGVTSGASIDSAPDVSFTYQGVNLECLSPVYAKGTRDGSGNFSGTFTRRSRLSSSWWVNGVEAPLGETTQAFEADVMSGSTVKRTISFTSPPFSYPAADQVTDFGSAQAAITFRIYQLSSVVGRGLPLEVTL
jgi:hypothetical protein